MINETLANELKKYLNTDNSEASLNSLSEFLNSTLDEIKEQKEKAAKKIQRARETDHLFATIRNYLLTHPKLSEEAKEAIKEEDIIEREDFEEAMDGLVELINTAVNLEAVLDDISLEDIFGGKSLAHLFTVPNTSTTATGKSVSLNPNCSFSGTITGNMNADTLAKFVSKF